MNYSYHPCASQVVVNPKLAPVTTCLNASKMSTHEVPQINPNVYPYQQQYLPQIAPHIVVNPNLTPVTTCINSSKMSTHQVQQINPNVYPYQPQYFSQIAPNPYFIETPPTLEHFDPPIQYPFGFVPVPAQYPYETMYQQIHQQIPNTPRLYTPSTNQSKYKQAKQFTPNSHKQQFLSTADSATPMQATRLEPISTDSPQTLATYFAHRIFVGSLSRTTCPGELAKFFNKFGLVIEAKIVLDNDGNSKGFGFVSFSSSEPVKRILSMGSIFMNNKRIAVASAIRKKHYDD